jgi:triphosphoribosyl-dephospho-CoA synthetase
LKLSTLGNRYKATSQYDMVFELWFKGCLELFSKNAILEG